MPCASVLSIVIYRYPTKLDPPKQNQELFPSVTLEVLIWSVYTKMPIKSTGA